MDLTQVFVHNLKKWRKNMGFSQKALAQRCNAAHSYIRQIESGTGHPSFAFIEKLAVALNIEPYKLFYDETSAKSGAESENIKTIRMDFLKNVSHEFDTAVEKMKIEAVINS
jgi:transcriptional regulator with XRE-family HTH domain